MTTEKAYTHMLFNLMVANDRQLLIKMYNKPDTTFLGIKVLNVCILISNDLLDRKHQSKLPGIVGRNLAQLSYNVFVKKYGTSGFDSFTSLD